MPFDVIAFYESAVQTLAGQVTPVPDIFYRIAGDYFFVQKYAPWLLGIHYTGVSTPAYCQVYQPGLKPNESYQSIRSCLTGAVNPWPGMLDLSKRPLPLSPDGQLAFRAVNATDEINTGILFLGSGPTSQAALDAVRPTHLLTGYTDTDCVAGTWVNATMVWDYELPAGNYAVVGMKGAYYKSSGPGNGAARLIFPDNGWHPGCLMSVMTADNTNVINNSGTITPFEFWPLMPGIAFDNTHMPGIQMFSGIANTDARFELMLQKIA